MLQSCDLGLAEAISTRHPLLPDAVEAQVPSDLLLKIRLLTDYVVKATEQLGLLIGAVAVVEVDYVAIELVVRVVG